jgi:[ribosomal protein S18]-alanine N-acetyltransferase
MSALPQQHISFRPMTDADLAEVTRIEPTIYSHPWTLGNFKDSLNAGYSAWVMEIAGNLVGYALVMMVLDEAHLLNLSVAKPFQGQGLGRTLLAHMIHISQRHQAANMFLEVRVSNTKAIALYEAMGFCEMGIRRNYYPTHHDREDAVLMGLAL